MKKSSPGSLPIPFSKGVLMRKSTIFISVVLTTFALVMLYRVASAYRQSSNVAVTAVPPTATLEATATELPIPTSTVVILAPEEAAQLAAQIVGNSNLLSAESATIDGLEAYKITFTNNDVVYIGLDGQVLSVQVAPVVVNVSAPVKEKHKNDNNNNVTVNSGGGEDQNHEAHEEPEEHED
jgi:hypothetical protein